MGTALGPEVLGWNPPTSVFREMTPTAAMKPSVDTNGSADEGTTPRREADGSDAMA